MFHSLRHVRLYIRCFSKILMCRQLLFFFVFSYQVILPSHEYTSCWDSRNRNARWVVERINIATITGTGDRKRVRERSSPLACSCMKVGSTLTPFFEVEVAHTFSPNKRRRPPLMAKTEVCVCGIRRCTPSSSLFLYPNRFVFLSFPPLPSR